jgi:hypothetical protein
MHLERVDTHQWKFTYKGRTYDLEVRVFLLPFGVGASAPVKYNYTLFADGEDVIPWQRDTREPFALVKAFAEEQFKPFADGWL